MRIREANKSDKFAVLEFCKNTFSWGDYVDKVWDYWVDEGNLLLLENKQQIGICHALLSQSQIWIEGIRIHPDYRRKGYASKLIEEAEHIGKQNNVKNSYMLIDVENSASLLMAKKSRYKIFQTWNFYSIEPNQNKNYKINFESIDEKPLQYVKSWRWLPFDNTVEKKLNQSKKIISSGNDEKKSFAILTDSEHFKKTLIITMFSNNFNADHEILKYLENFGYERYYERLQILCKEDLPNFSGLEKKLSFHLMIKKLS